MYHAGFINAKDYNGRLYREKITGNSLAYCSHSYIIKPRFEDRDKTIANEFSYPVKTFDGFKGICEYCGEVILIRSEDVIDDETFDKRIDERVKEINEKSRRKK